MDVNEIKTAEEPVSDYEKAYREMLAFRESFLKLSKPEQERLIKAIVPVWDPKADPLKTRFIVNTVTKLLR